MSKIIFVLTVKPQLLVQSRCSPLKIAVKYQLITAINILVNSTI